MRKGKTVDPFEQEDHYQRTKQVLKSGERGTFVETTMTNQTPVVDETSYPVSLDTYTRIHDLAPSLELFALDDIQNEDIIVWSYIEQKGTPDMGPFLTLECSKLGSSREDLHFLTNCGGQDAMRKIKNAFALVAEGKAIGPLVARFHKIKTQSGNSFWVLS